MQPGYGVYTSPQIWTIDPMPHRARWAVVILVSALVIWVGGGLALHFGQIRHNQLGYDIEREFPPDKTYRPGEIFASTLAAIMDHELHTGFGWRPNDFPLWGPKVAADNNANRQLGIIMAVRETMRVFKDHLTKVSSNEYDQNLVVADTDFRNDAERWILPAPEGKYNDGIEHLRAYVAGLRASPPTSRELNLRSVELIRLFQTWTDLLGDAHARLYSTRRENGRPIGIWDCDKLFYHAQGYAHVIYHMMLAVNREYSAQIKSDPVLESLMNDSIDALGKAAVMKPLIVFNGSPDGIFANHRRNLDTYITEARQKMYSIREELQRSPL
ncbi:MAG TPA: DUF2333 family protein [Candidatus Binataceae bacterium]|nr:DUF2333 family protein [Candidatus Binataceae bacterium]